MYVAEKFQELYESVTDFYPPSFVQDNLSFSKKNVVRGMHFQKKKPQGELVRVINGKILDVIVDLRRDSKTFGCMESFELTPYGQSIYVPEGFAHGFWSLSENTIVHYKCTTMYDKSDEDGLNPADKSMKYPWINELDSIVISEKDKSYKGWKEYV